MTDDIVKRSVLDRRSGEDKRKTYSLDYFAEGGIDADAETSGASMASAGPIGLASGDGAACIFGYNKMR